MTRPLSQFYKDLQNIGCNGYVFLVDTCFFSIVLGLFSHVLCNYMCKEFRNYELTLLFEACDMNMIVICCCVTHGS